MARGLNDLADRFEEIADNLDSGILELKALVVTKVQYNLVWGTPVDTSEALSNWQVSVGTPSYNRLDPYAEGSKGSTQTISAEAAIAQGQRALAGNKLGQSIWISNNTPYIGDLNRGTSTQVPAGFVERAVAIAHRVITTYRFKL